MSTGKELALVIFDRIDAVHHSLIGREHAVCCIIILFLYQVGHRKIRKKIYETALSLCNQRVSVRQKQNITNPALFLQNFYQRNDGSCLAGPGRHDQKSLTSILLPKTVTNSLNCSFLIISPRDILIDNNVREAGSHRLKIEKLFQIALGVDLGTSALRIQIILDSGFKSICQENHRPPAVLFLQKIRIKLCLLSAFCHVHTGSLCFDHSQWPAVVTIQYIVRISDT